MSPITSLIITQVCNKSAKYIFETFRGKGLATIDRVLLLPYNTILKDSPEEQGCLAIVDIHEWHDTEIAYQFISDLNRGNVVKVVHDTFDTAWFVARNHSLNIQSSSHIQSPYLTEFSYQQITQYDDEDDAENIHISEQWKGTNLETAFRMET